MTLGSLFSGSGGFELAGLLNGIEPIWASEIEPFPIMVTKKRFPNMKHYGDVSKIKGDEIEPVDIITFGSPCQDLSIAGKRAGIEGERSGLFYEAIRIIKEMRKATNGEKPKYIVWENVYGAFSSNNGEDFRLVLEEIVGIKEAGLVIPRPARWLNAGEIVGHSFSVAWRTLDAQFWNVPQRRVRVFLVADFRGAGAGEILFKQECLRGYSPKSRNAKNETAEDTRRCVKSAGFPLGFRPENVRVYDEKATTICNGTRAGYTCGVLEFLREDGQRRGGKGVLLQHNRTGALSTLTNQYVLDDSNAACYSVENHGMDNRYRIDKNGKVQTLAGQMGTGGGNVPLTLVKTKAKYRVRRLTPTECARLQGFPDWWCDDLEDDDFEFWRNVWDEYARLNNTKPKTDKAVREWMKHPHSDSAEYKMWGNGVALPCVDFILWAIKECENENNT